MRCVLLGLVVLVAPAGCNKKEEAPAPPSASAGAQTSAAPAPLPPGDTPAEKSSVPDPVKVAATAATPVEPNAPPPHQEHVQAAATEIHKGNYKSELEALEKEDLSADRK